MNRMRAFTVFVFVAVILVTVVPAKGALLIDDFETGSIGDTDDLLAVGKPLTYQAHTEYDATSAIGGQRFSELTWKSGGDDQGQETAKLEITSGTYASYSATASVSAEFEFTYGAGGDLDLDLSGTNGEFILDFAGASDPAQLTVTVNQSSTASASLASGQTSVVVPFASFSTQPNWGAVDRMSFALLAPVGAGGGTVGYSLDEISVSVTPTAIPEPTSLSLLGLLAVCALGRRRRR